MANSINASNSVQSTGIFTPRADSTGNSAPSSTSGTLVSRADGVAENLLGLLAEYKQKVEELEGKLTTELQRGEDSLDIQNEIIAEKEDEIGMLQRELDDRKRKARDALARKDKECEERSESFRIEMQEKYERLIAAAKGVVGSDLKGLGMKIGELEGALDGLTLIQLAIFDFPFVASRSFYFSAQLQNATINSDIDIMDDRIDPPTTDSSTMGRRSKRQRKEVSNYNVKRTLSDMLNPQAKKPRSPTSMAADLYQSRASDAVDIFHAILVDIQRELQDAKKGDAEMSRKIKAAEEAKRALADEVLAATEGEREKIVELTAELARCETEVGKREEKFKRLVTAARGVGGSHSIQMPPEWIAKSHEQCDFSQLRKERRSTPHRRWLNSSF